jgi:two-component sensor histidine kinase
LGTLFAMMCNYEKAILYYRQSIEAAEKWGNKLGVLLTEENICSLYVNTKNYELAHQTSLKAYNLACSLGDSIRIAAVFSLDGDIEMALGHPDIALSKYQKAKAIFELKKDKPKLSSTYLSLGGVYFQQKKYVEAADNFNKCQQLADYLSPVCFADFYHKLGKLYVEQKQTNKAIEAFTMSLQKSDTLELLETARNNHIALAQLLQHNQPHKAYEHLIIANSLGDSLSVHAQSKSMTEAQLRFDLEKRDLQIEAQQQALTQSKWARSILVFLLLVVLILLFFVWRQMKAKLHAMNHIELLMKELHHRVKNNLQTITSIMRLQARHITDPKVAAVLGESRSRLEAISMIHQQLYRSDDVQSVNFKVFLESLIEKQLFTHGFCNNTFNSQIKLEKEFMNVELALPLGLIINELLTNSFKYAYPSVESPKLSIEIDSKNLIYSDNGQGLPPQFTTENPKSFGVQLIVSLTQQLRGKCQFGSKNGMFFILTY